MPTFLHTVEYKGTDGNMYTLNPVTVDDEVNASSENPVQNKVIKSYVDSSIDDAMGNAVTDVTYDVEAKKLKKQKNGVSIDVVELAEVATSGDYGDLINAPTIPTVDYPVTDVEVNGTSVVTNKVANIPEASTSTAGVVTTGSQTFAGIKTFNSGIHIAGTISGNTYSIEQPADPLTGVMSYTLTLPEKSGTIATTDQTIQELTTQSVRIWDLEPGIYKWAYSGSKTLYYKGATDTASYFTIGTYPTGTDYNDTVAIIKITNYYIGTEQYKGYEISRTEMSNNYITFGYSTSTTGSVNTKSLSNIPNSAITTTTSVTSGSSALVTSGGVYTAIQNAITTALNNSY